MMAVIADDFTGAAELAGIALRYDLKVELATSVITDPSGDLVVICTDSRSMNQAAAMKATESAATEVLKLNPRFVYKKIDSVFRGHVLDELLVQMKLSGKKKALVVGANPSLGRTIKNGKYYIHGDAISDTDFGTDPEFAITDSSVLGMIRADKGTVRVLKSDDTLPAEGIVFGEAQSASDINAWASEVDDTWLLAGAGDFFTALLDKKFKASSKAEIEIQTPHLYVSGTAFGRSRDYVKGIKHRLGCVAYLPAKMMLTGNINNDSWFTSVFDILDKQNKGVIAIDDDDVDPFSITAVHLRNTMASVVKKILEKGIVRELFIEGGSTAAAILNEMGVKKLAVVNELQRGIVRMKVNDLFITVKPGSYELPAQIKRIYT